MAEIDWSLFRAPDIGGNALRFYMAGQEQRQEQERQNALMAYRDREEQRAIDATAYQQGRDVAADQRQSRLDGQLKYIETDNMIYGLNPFTGQKVFEQPLQPKPPTAPSGYRLRSDGNLEYIPGGPGDPTVYGERAQVQRKAVVQNPMPRAAGGGGAGLGGMSNEQLIALARSLK